MNAHQHEIVRCSCGRVIRQCRCLDPGKQVFTLATPCLCEKRNDKAETSVTDGHTIAQVVQRIVEIEESSVYTPWHAVLIDRTTELAYYKWVGPIAFVASRRRMQLSFQSFGVVLGFLKVSFAGFAEPDSLRGLEDSEIDLVAMSCVKDNQAFATHIEPAITPGAEVYTGVVP